VHVPVPPLLRYIFTVTSRDTLQYREVLRRTHEACRPAVYVEIGVKYGGSIVLAQPGTRIVGVDPSPQLRVALPPDTDLVEETSDDFFEHSTIADVAGAPADLSFIDGWHAFDFALRDFRNLERNSHTSSVILFHDCYPRNVEKQHLAADVWKLALALRDYRPDLDLRTVDTPPTGLGLVRGLDPSNTVLWDKYDEILERYRDLDFATAVERGDLPIRRVAPTWGDIRASLPPTPFRAATTSDKLRATSRRGVRTARRFVKLTSARARNRVHRLRQKVRQQ
jgi:hypothetical protein